MKCEKLAIIVAVDNSEIRETVSKTLIKNGRQDFDIMPSYNLQHIDPLDAIIVLETNDDVAALTQIVYETYANFKDIHVCWIIGITSKDQMRLNPKLTMWNVNDHAALLTLLASNDPLFVKYLNALISRAIKSYYDYEPGQ